jgi:orotate phosphoribosyltransferase
MPDPYHFRSYNDLADDVTRLVQALPHDIDAVAGIPRSGLLAATMIASALNVPLLFGGTMAGGNRVLSDLDKTPQRVLLVDDSINTGTAMARQVKQINPAYTCAVYAINRDQVDFYSRLLPIPRLFEWNLWNHYQLGLTMLDMDGILCEDPPMHDDGGKEYADYLADAVPRYKPRRLVRAICTARLEKWREVTEAWLARHGILYGKLHMFPSDKESDRKGLHASFKASCYVADDRASLFIESDAAQARAIAINSDKSVLCYATKTMLNPQDKV